MAIAELSIQILDEQKITPQQAKSVGQLVNRADSVFFDIVPRKNLPPSNAGEVSWTANKTKSLTDKSKIIEEFKKRAGVEATPKPKVTKRKKAPITDAVKTLVGREDVTEYETPAETRKKKETKRKLSPSVILDLFAEERDRLVKEEKEKEARQAEEDKLTDEEFGA